MVTFKVVGGLEVRSYIYTRGGCLAYHHKIFAYAGDARGATYSSSDIDSEDMRRIQNVVFG